MYLYKRDCPANAPALVCTVFSCEAQVIPWPLGFFTPTHKTLVYVHVVGASTWFTCYTDKIKQRTEVANGRVFVRNCSRLGLWLGAIADCMLRACIPVFTAHGCGQHESAHTMRDGVFNTNSSFY